jgi:poly(3-hydroxybutyrate) depolymerase
MIMRTIIIFTMVLAIAATQPFAQAGSMQVDGKKRDYTVYAPSSGLPTNPPLLLGLHALAQTAAQFRSASKWDAMADKEKFIVVYPVGTFPVKDMGNMIGWDIYSEADVKFLTALMDTMEARYKIDRKRVYSTGYSMGGMMSYTLACSVPGKITAIGPGAGYPLGVDINSCQPARPVPVCHVHGTKDGVVAYSGVAAWINKFAALGKCPQSPTTTNPSSTIKKEYWGPCENGDEVILYSITGMDHIYPSPSNGFSAVDTFWAFFKKHSIGDATGTEKPVQGARTVQTFSAACSGGKIHLAVNREINSVRIFDVHGRTIYTWKEPTRHVGNLIAPVGHASGGICIIKVEGPAGSSVGRVLIP